MDRRTFLASVGAGAAALAMRHALAQDARKPNIIFILADDLGYGDLGCFGQQEIKTPNLDALAREGMLLTDHYAGSTVCAPSRCVLMTGYHTGHAYVRDNAKLSLLPEHVTIPEVLKQADYATGMVGKWGIGQEGSDGMPTRQGFDFFYGYLDQTMAHNYYPEFLIKNEDRVSLLNKVPDAGEYGQGVATEKVEYSHDLILREGLNYVVANQNRPFFLYMALTIPHANNEAGDQGMEVPDYGIYADKDWPEPQKGHAAMISRMDDGIGKLVATLKRLGIYEHTMIVFSSDNGPHKEGGNDPAFHKSSGPLRGIKRDMYEGGIRVPTFVHWPGKVAAGTSSGLPSAFWDWMPTLAEIVGTTPPEGIDGISILPTLLGKPDAQQQHEYLYWEFQGKQGLRMGKWKAVRVKQGEPLELYNLAEDLGETTNVAAQNPEVVSKIEELLVSARTESEQFPLVKQ